MYKLLITTLLFASTFISFSQSKNDLIQQAIMAGYSQEQINSAIQSVESGNNTSGKPVGTEKTSEDELRVYDKYETTYPEEEKVIVVSDNKSTVYGHEIFSSKNLTFAPSYNIPTPKNYILSASDEVVVKIWGASKDEYRLIVSPEGTISLGTLGPVFVSGLTVEKAESLLKNELSQIIQGVEGDMPTTFVSVTLGRIRSIKVNILGEVVMPGTYTLPSLATLFNALYVAGGVNDTGSLREIQLFRNGKKISTLDVYRFIFNGDNNTNVRLEDNDMIVVSPYSALVTIEGNVKRKRTFELKAGETMSDLLSYSGGFTGDAFEDFVNIDRKTSSTREILTVNKSNFPVFIMKDCDLVSVSKVLNTYSNKVIINGSVWRTGSFELNGETNSASKLISKAGGLKPDAFYGKAHITRTNSDGTKKIVAFNLGDVVDGKSDDVPILDKDSLYIYSIDLLKEDYTVLISGEVRNNGVFSYAENMTVKDLIQMAGGFKEAASTSKIEISRRIKNMADTLYSPVKSQLFIFNIDESLELEPEGKRFVLEPFDVVMVRNSPNYAVQRSVFVEGEVLFDGRYVIAQKGMRISDLINKAGGVTPDAYVIGARLERTMNDDERKKLELMMSFNSDNKDSLLMSTVALRSVYSVGINLEMALANPGSYEDVVIRENDKLIVPEYVSTVSINGAVRRPNVVTYSDTRRLKDYISDAGGYLQRAKVKSIYVVYMNGTVSQGKRSVIKPGCEIIVPMKLEKRGTGVGLMTGLSLLNSTMSTAAMITNLIK